MIKDKTALRSEIIERRDGIPSEVRQVKDSLVMERLLCLKEFTEAGTVLLFASFRSEINTIPIIENALKEDRVVVLPRVDRDNRRLILYSIAALSELQEGYMGIPEPPGDGDKIVLPEDLEFILMPGVAFDELGGRLGYGGGYYDRLIGALRERPPLVALAYEEQIVEEVPVSGHDIRVNRIVTDRRIIEVAAGTVSKEENHTI